MGNITLLFASGSALDRQVADILIARLEQEIERQGYNYKSLSLAAGLGETTVRDIIMRRALNPRRDTLQKIAKTLGKPVSFLIPDEMPETVPLTGVLGGGGQIHRAMAVSEKKRSGQDAFVEAPPEQGHRELAAIQVEGDALAPFLPDKTLIYYSAPRSLHLEDYLGKLCVVQVRGKGPHLKILQAGMLYGCYNLADYDGTVQENAEVEWCAKVVFIKQP